MGSTGSRPRPSQVAPCQGEGGPELTHPMPQWTLAVLPTTMEMGQRRTILPPLKREAALSTLSESRFTGSLPATQSNNPSIYAHPPRRLQALRPLALQIGQAGAGRQAALARDCRDGDVHRFSTPSQTGNSGAGRLMQGGFLEAQMAFSQQVHRHRRTHHHRQAQKQRKQKIVYTANVGGPSQEVNRRVHLVRRPTERDIFWDESRGESLDLRSLLQPSPLPPLG